METDADITLGRKEGFITGFWWILPNLGPARVAFLLFVKEDAHPSRSGRGR